MSNVRYRKDYIGEFVITSVNWIDGVKNESREWIPNVIQNTRISDRAVVIGSRMMQERFDHRRLVHHRGGLMGSKKLQTYGTSDIWTDMRLDFYLSTNEQHLLEIDKCKYYTTTVIMTSGTKCLTYPGKFFLVPYMPNMDDLVLAVYVAAFDNHKEIFLLGYNQQTPSGSASWIYDLDQIIKKYYDTQFYFVGSAASMADMWRTNPNAASIPLRQWISYCDI